eukprot:6210876-Pleurochrysis_carterae.AAC.2
MGYSASARASARGIQSVTKGRKLARTKATAAGQACTQALSREAGMRELRESHTFEGCTKF